MIGSLRYGKWILVLLGCLATGLLLIFLRLPLASADNVGIQAPYQPSFTFGGSQASTQGYPVNLAVANTTDVQNIQSTAVKLYFTSNNAHTVTIERADACDASGEDYVGGPSIGDPANRFRVYATNANENSAGGALDQYDAVVVNSSNCNNTRTLRIPNGSLTLSTETGYYVALFVADNPRSGINNTFRVQVDPADGGEYAGIVGRQPFGLDEKDNRNGYTRYNLAFGSDCSVPAAGRTATIRWYDLDNGTSGIQPNPAQFRLYNQTTGNFVTLSNVVNGNRVSPTEVRPSGGSGVNGSADFFARQNHDYRIVWNSSGIYSNNTLEMQLPFDQVFYRVNCLSTPPTTGGSYTITTTTPEYEKGSGSANITGTLSVNAYPCDTARPQGTGTVATNVTWRLTGPGMPATTTVTTIPNCSGTVVNNTISRTVPAATLNPAPVGPFGPYQGRVTNYGAVPGVVTAPPAFIAIYSLPYPRFYGNDVSAAGCTPTPAGPNTANVPVGRPNNGDPLYGSVVGPLNSASLYASTATEYAAIALTTKPNNPNTGAFQNHPSAPNRLRAFWQANSANATCPNIVYNRVTSTLPATVNTTISTATFTLPATADNVSQYHVRTGDLVLNQALNRRGKHTVFVNGNLRISGNQTTSFSNPTSFDNTTAPYLLFVVSGDVYIDPSVDRIDAVIVSRQDIATCSNNGFSFAAQSSIHSTCNSKLTINGALVAHYIHFKRSSGSRLFAPNYEPSNAPSGNNAAAEVINYPYYMYFATPHLVDQSNSSFQSYFSPAPYF